ncbi:MAG TPA: hypothetical protein VFS56_01305 [Gemmatimonadaceae bacterium]|nr:hypothetical protein [Gemmatimonadaceae bacterium]
MNAIAIVGAIVALTACASGPQPVGGAHPGPVPAPGEDTTGKTSVPPGYGTLRQDEIAIRLELQGLIVRAIPLEESLIRLLTADSYRALRELQESNKEAIAAIARRRGGQLPDLWYVSFYGVAPDVNFSPMELIITSSGRNFRALDVIPLSSGFGEQRLRQRETQSALYLYDEEIDLDQPLTVTFLDQQSATWEQILTRVERERVLVRARASRSGERD